MDRALRIHRRASGLHPAQAGQRVRSKLDQGVEDLSFPAPARSWRMGIPMPITHAQRVVWMDALSTTNQSALGSWPPIGPNWTKSSPQVRGDGGEDKRSSTSSARTLWFHACTGRQLMALDIPCRARSTRSGCATSEGRKCPRRWATSSAARPSRNLPRLQRGLLSLLLLRARGVRHRPATSAARCSPTVQRGDGQRPGQPAVANGADDRQIFRRAVPEPKWVFAPRLRLTLTVMDCGFVQGRSTMTHRDLWNTWNSRLPRPHLGIGRLDQPVHRSDRAVQAGQGPRRRARLGTISTTALEALRLALVYLSPIMPQTSPKGLSQLGWQIPRTDVRTVRPMGRPAAGDEGDERRRIVPEEMKKRNR